MDNAYSVDEALRINFWPWIAGFTMLLATLFLTGSLSVALYNSTPGYHYPWPYLLHHHFSDVVAPNLLLFCGFPLLWSLVSVGMWSCFFNGSNRPTAGKGMLALFLADVIALLLSVVIIWFSIQVLVSVTSHDDGKYTAFQPLVYGAIAICQAVLYLPLVLLIGAIIAKLQASAWSSAS